MALCLMGLRVVIFSCYVDVRSALQESPGDIRIRFRVDYYCPPIPPTRMSDIVRGGVGASRLRDLLRTPPIIAAQ